MADIRPLRRSRIDPTDLVPADDLEFRRRRKTRLPGSGIFATTMTSKAKLVYCALRSHAWTKQEVWPSLPTIAAESSLSIKTVRNAIIELDRKGWITVEDVGSGRQSTVYIIHKTQKRTLEDRYADARY